MQGSLYVPDYMALPASSGANTFMLHASAEGVIDIILHYAMSFTYMSFFISLIYQLIADSE